MPTRTVVIIGGGIAGLATAVRLIQLGLKPIVLEKRPFLGGRAYSFTDSDTGEEIDNGQHVFVGACDELQKYIDYASYNNNPKQQRTSVDKYWVLYVDLFHHLKSSNEEPNSYQ